MARRRGRRHQGNSSRYPALGFVVAMYNVMAGGIVVVGLFVLIQLIASGIADGKLIIGIMFGITLAAISLVAAAESIKVVVDISNQTAETNNQLALLRKEMSHYLEAEE